MSDTAALPTTYAATEHEGTVYGRWEESGCFKAGAGARPGKPAYTIMIPPPNVTGVLHMGHALNNTLQDTLIRWQRMQGCDTLWQPGTDHAGIATQSVVARKLDEAGGPSREQLGREAFLQKVWAWKEQYGSAITGQLRKLGSSCDWSRERFTMDEGLSRAVRENFVRLYEAGLIHRGMRLVNWSPALQTALANDEVEPEEVQGNLWRLRYTAADASFTIDVETTRPETFFGDTAVAVHPDDARYRGLIGKKVKLPIIGREIPIIADEHADPTKGSGAVKITPAHDPNDYQVGLRHGLDMPTVMNRDGTMNHLCGPYAGLDRYACRKQLLADLRASGVLQGERAITHTVGHCYRSHVPVEPMLTEQWFVKMAPLAERALAETREGRVNFHPERWTKVYASWLENVQDWCISRQIWWGHRIPAWYCADCGHTTVSREDPTRCSTCGGTHLRQDEDVLDTWFSSALWPFSTLGWPEADAALARYYPTDVLVTDRGIIYFWVARMVMMGLFNLDRRPFSDVYIHGTVLDENGTKMSKSLGNGIDPLVMIQGGTQSYLGKDYECPGYGADAVRYTLLDMTTEGQDLKLSPSRFEAGRNFANKVFNAGRFVLMNLSERPLATLPDAASLQQLELDLPARWILDRLQNAVAACQDALTRFRFADYVGAAYRYFRDELCDWYLEWAKRQFKIGGTAATTAAAVLAHCFDASLRLLHPGMPFLTEYLWQHLQGAVGGRAWSPGSFLMLSPWPEAQIVLRVPGLAERMAQAQALVAAVRQIRNELGLPDRERLVGAIEAGAEMEELLGFLCDRANADLRLASLTTAAAGVTAVVGATRLRIELGAGQAQVLATYKAKLAKQLDARRKSAEGKRGRLGNEKYVSGAAPEKVQETRDLLAQDEAAIASMEATLAGLAG